MVKVMRDRWLKNKVFHVKIFQNTLQTLLSCKLECFSCFLDKACEDSTLDIFVLSNYFPHKTTDVLCMKCVKTYFTFSKIY